VKKQNHCSCKACTFVACALCVLCLLSSAAPASAAPTLDDAYRTELTRLTAEKNSMRKALRQATARGEKTRSSLVGEIESLAAKLTRLRADNSKKAMQVPQAERLHSMQEQERSIERREIQIETWLETHGVHLPHGDGDDHDKERHEHPPLDAMVAAALDHVEEHGQLRVQSNQEYFGSDGVAKEGSVLHIAEVGAVAVDEAYRPLELAPDGSLRVTNHFAPQPVTHGDSRTVGVMLFDPDDIRPTRDEEAGWQSWIERGGVVMWAIAALAMLAVLLTLERLLAFAFYLIRLWRAERRGVSVPVASDDKLLRAVAVVQSGQGSAESLESEAAEAVLQAQQGVRRGVSLLAVVASVAPLLGLLGTVTGMIGTFGVITEHGTGDPRLLSGGISEALLTTQFGLMVAIPALLFQTTLYRSGDAILRRVERFALHALEARFQVLEDDAVPDNVIVVRSER
jgi:biopolymer transport protein ExbB